MEEQVSGIVPLIAKNEFSTEEFHLFSLESGKEGSCLIIKMAQPGLQQQSLCYSTVALPSLLLVQDLLPPSHCQHSSHLKDSGHVISARLSFL